MEAPRKSKSSRKKKIDKKKSGVRTKFLIESLRNDYFALRAENDKLRGLVTSELPDSTASYILSQCYDPNAPKVDVNNVDHLATEMAGTSIEEEDMDAVGF